jgi:hypothetical protein
MTQKTFSAQVDDWVRATKERVEVVFHEAAQDIAEEIVAKTPVDTGYLRHSFAASGEQMPMIRAEARPAEGAKYSFDAGPINLVIMNVPLGKTIFLGFSASYSTFVEFGAQGRPARAMVRLSAQNWEWIVAEAVSRAKAAVRANERRDQSL